MEFQKSAILLDDFISTENDVWGNRENPVFDWMNLIRAKKGYTFVTHLRNFASVVDLIAGVLLSCVFILKQ